jgi:hypothetical protein
MPGETLSVEELTPEQSEMADFLIEQCGFEGIADVQISYHGQNGSVRYALGVCPDFAKKTREELIGTVEAIIEHGQIER